MTGLKYGLPLLSPVDDAGRFTAEAGERFKGLNVLKVCFYFFRFRFVWWGCRCTLWVRLWGGTRARPNFRRLNLMSPEVNNALR